MAGLTLREEEFEAIRGFIEERSGISVGDSKRYLIETRLSGLAQEVGCSSFGELGERLRANPDSALTDQVVDAMTTNETLWFRDAGPWAILRDTLLPRFCEDLASGKKSRIRIWSAACSTGQEPYSIAMTIHEYIRDIGCDAKADSFQIVATDLSPSALFVAQSGRYETLSIERGLEPELRERYFEQSGNAWVADSRLRQMVRVERRNLMEPFDDLLCFDLILCRNVLIYFSADLKREIVSRFADQLTSQGALIIGASESLQGMMGVFKMKQTSGNFYYEASAGEAR